jgi:hypothetical protein
MRDARHVCPHWPCELVELSTGCPPYFPGSVVVLAEVTHVCEPCSFLDENRTAVTRDLKWCTRGLK